MPYARHPLHLTATRPARRAERSPKNPGAGSHSLIRRPAPANLPSYEETLRAVAVGALVGLLAFGVAASAILLAIIVEALS